MKKTTKKAKVNKDVDEQAEGISYEKGREFEYEFANYMRKELKWDKVRVGAHMTGLDNAKGTSIDILGERLDYKGVKYKSNFNKWIYGSIGAGFCSFLCYYNSWGSDGEWFLMASLISLFIAYGFKYMSELNNQQHAWVECKNLKTKVTINHISKMLREYNDYKASKNPNYRFTNIYFASANGYVENALKTAMDNGVICYVKEDESFVEVKYWNK